MLKNHSAKSCHRVFGIVPVSNMTSSLAAPTTRGPKCQNRVENREIPSLAMLVVRRRWQLRNSAKARLFEVKSQRPPTTLRQTQTPQEKPAAHSLALQNTKPSSSTKIVQDGSQTPPETGHGQGMLSEPSKQHSPPSPKAQRTRFLYLRKRAALS